MQVFAEDKLSGDEVRHLANKIGEKSTMAYFKDYLLKMDRDFHAGAKDIIREYYKIEPFRKELENQWENVKEAYKKGEMSLKEFKFLSKYKDEKRFLNQVAGILWHHNRELVKNRGYTINKYGQIEEGKANYYQNLALEYDGALKTLKKWFYYIQKANKQAQRFFNKKELEALELKPSAPESQGSVTMSKNTGYAEPVTPNETHKSIIAQKNENILQSNPHLGAGLVGGVLNGLETDEEGNITGFDPAKFAMGFLGGAIGSKAVSSAYKAKYYEKNFNKFIDEVNAKKEQIKPRFILTQELEKAYRENELKIKQSAAEKLNLKGKIFADYIKLAKKHPEYFANPQEAKELSEFIAQNASVGIKASKKEYELIFAEIQGGKGVFALDLEYKGGKHRIRSVYLMKNMQYKKKLFEAKKLGFARPTTT